MFPIQKVVTLDESSVANDKVETTVLHRYREKWKITVWRKWSTCRA
jgi:hypothetical protein